MIITCRDNVNLRVGNWIIEEALNGDGLYKELLNDFSLTQLGLPADLILDRFSISDEYEIWIRGFLLDYRNKKRFHYILLTGKDAKLIFPRIQEIIQVAIDLKTEEAELNLMKLRESQRKVKEMVNKSITKSDPPPDIKLPKV